jgi:hypothetical protein
MPGRPWTTKEEADFLAEYIPQYVQAQSNHSLSSVFWPLVYREWFEKYSEKERLFPGVTHLTAEQEDLLRDKLDQRRMVSSSCITMHHRHLQKDLNTDVV